MATTLHVLRMLALSLWVGGIAFFAFGVAPVAFHVLPTPHLAGLVVAGSLHVLHQIAFFCGGTVLLLSALLLATRQPAKAAILPGTLVIIMLALTLFSAGSIIPRMERDRAAGGGAIESLPSTAPARLDFDRLHHTSEQVEGGVLLCGLIALVLLSADPSGRDSRHASA